jgi:hypothetical protein
VLLILMLGTWFCPYPLATFQVALLLVLHMTRTPGRHWKGVRELLSRKRKLKHPTTK